MRILARVRWRQCAAAALLAWRLWVVVAKEIAATDARTAKEARRAAVEAAAAAEAEELAFAAEVRICDTRLS